MDALNTLLTSLSAYRKKDPQDADDIEKMENIFDALCSLLIDPESKAAFRESEGLELMLLMIKYVH
jgi:beta-catenin-like protein 1